MTTISEKLHQKMIVFGHFVQLITDIVVQLREVFASQRVKFSSVDIVLDNNAVFLETMLKVTT